MSQWPQPHTEAPPGPLESRKRRRHLIACPHCGHFARVRTSRLLAAVYAEAYMQCDNHLCGHVFVCAVQVLRSVSPSACPNPEIHIPLARNVLASVLGQQLELLLEEQANG